MSNSSDVIYLVSCAVNNVIPDRSRVEKMDLDEVYRVAAHHMLKAAVAFALESAGIKDERSRDAISRSQRKTALFANAWEEIKPKLEEAGIWYMPLKGAILKDLYPKFGMREFSDYDILFDASRASDMKNIMEELGFTTVKYGTNNHDIYYKAPVLNFEMHTELMSFVESDRVREYYSHIEDRLIRDASYERRFAPEDCYIYLIVHQHKHYSRGGTGLRSLMDTYIYLKHEKLDMCYVAAETDKLGIRDYEEINRSLSQHLFDGEKLTPTEQEMLDYILSSGTYGTIKHNIQNKMQKRKWNKLQYALNRFFVPVKKTNPDYSVYARLYPTWYQHKILLLVLPFYRVARAVRSGRFKVEVKELRDV